MYLQLAMPLTWFQFSPIVSVFKSKKTQIDVLFIHHEVDHLDFYSHSWNSNGPNGIRTRDTTVTG